MKILINKEKILNNTGIKFDENINYLYYIQRAIEELESHNKNYTKKQYYKIIDIKEILNNIEIEED